MTIVEKIHKEIDTAQDRLLKSAEEVINNTEITPETKIESKAARLEKLGFTSTVVVEKANEVKKSRDEKLKKVSVSKEQANLINYYKQKYPLHKFLTEEELDRICDKYSLIHAPVKNYVKDIPEKNLHDMETMKEISEEDYFETTYKFNKVRDEGFWMAIGHPDKTITTSDYVAMVEKYYGHCPKEWESPTESDTGLFAVQEKVGGSYMFNTVEVVSKEGLFIAAPKSHFNLKNLTKKNEFGFFEIVKIEPKDPIVFKYVKGGLLVITKWGDEADDDLLINGIDN